MFTQSGLQIEPAVADMGIQCDLLPTPFEPVGMSTPVHDHGSPTQDDDPASSSSSAVLDASDASEYHPSELSLLDVVNGSPQHSSPQK